MCGVAVVGLCLVCYVVFFFFFFMQKTAYGVMPSLGGSEMCIRGRIVKLAQAVVVTVVVVVIDGVTGKSKQHR